MDPTLMTEEERMKRRRELFAPTTMGQFNDPLNVMDRTAMARETMRPVATTIQDRQRMFDEVAAANRTDRNMALDRATTLDVADRQFVQGPAGEATIKGRFDLFGEIARGQAGTAQETIRQGADILKSRLAPAQPDAPFKGVGDKVFNERTGQIITPPAQPVSNQVTQLVDKATGQPIPGAYINDQGQVIRLTQPAGGSYPLPQDGSAPAPEEPQTVQMKMPDGTIRRVPKDRVEQITKAGGVAI